MTLISFCPDPLNYSKNTLNMIFIQTIICTHFFYDLSFVSERNTFICEKNKISQGNAKLLQTNAKALKFFLPSQNFSITLPLRGLSNKHVFTV